VDSKTKKAVEDVVKTTVKAAGKAVEDVVKAAGTKAEAAPAPAVSAKAAMAEFVAMTLFVIIGCGSAMSVAKESGWILQVALTFGLAITSLAYSVGHYSGGQINCAVTLGLVVAGKLSMAQGIANFVAQMLGSVCGALILKGMFPEDKDKTGGLATNAVSEGWTQMHALVGEIAMTFLLMFVVMETAVNPASKANRELACVAIGFAVFLAHSVLISIDGCSINPTRTFGPALVRSMTYKNGEGAFSDHWVFWAGPLVGAAAAAVVSTQMMK
jgi:MIP family channel proteins